MRCVHSRDAEQDCPACTAAWKAEGRGPYWRTTARCPHVTQPQSGYRRQEAMATTIVDANDSERILVGGCERCGTAMPASKARR